MTTQGSPQVPRAPGAAGCLLALATALSVVVGVAFVLMFLDSGADRGLITLLDRQAYPPGTVSHEPASGFFLVSLGDDLLAIVDIDAANRTQSGRQCRIRSVSPGEPQAVVLVARYGSRFSPEARGTTVVLTEDCNFAAYDIAGTRLDEDGPNLDRLGVSLDERGRVVVDTQDRECTERAESELRLPRDCPGR